MKILELTEAFGGGVFTSLTRLSSGLAARGHEVHLAYARRGETPDDVAAHVHAAVQLHELALVRPIRPLADLAGMMAIRRLLATVRPDIVHVHSSKAGVLGRIAAVLSGDRARLFYSPRGLAFLQEDYSPRARALFERIERLMARIGGTIVACSQSEATLIRERLHASKIALVENAVDVEAVVPRVEREDAEVRIGIVGRITYARNSALFADMASRHRSDRVLFRWIGGGDGPEQSRLASAGVTVSGWMPREQALDAMSQLDIYLHPSRWEGMPVALIEAQVAGLPAVATDVVGNRDVIRHGETGFVESTPEALSQSLGRLIADAGLRRRMGARARELALPRFNVDRMIDDCERLYATAAPRVVRSGREVREGA
jgi:glycosyltransferase involved in cell wall biosynthesis